MTAQGARSPAGIATASRGPRRDPREIRTAPPLQAPGCRVPPKFQPRTGARECPRSSGSPYQDRASGKSISRGVELEAAESRPTNKRARIIDALSIRKVETTAHCYIRYRHLPDIGDQPEQARQRKSPFSDGNQRDRSLSGGRHHAAEIPLDLPRRGRIEHASERRHDAPGLGTSAGSASGLNDRHAMLLELQMLIPAPGRRASRDHVRDA
jgi:hypothetical protein